MNLTLRPYQRDAVAAVAAEFAAGRRTTLVVHPTGCGKTVVFSAVAASAVSTGWRVLVLAHRGQLVDQAASRISRDTGLSSSVEMAERRSDPSSSVVVASVQSMVTRLDRFERDAFGLIIIDEAHHVTPGSMYSRVTDWFESARVLGVTATPDRLDGKGMGRFFESVAHSYDIMAAIGDGHLVPILQKRVLVDHLDLGEVEESGGDFDSDSLAEVMLNESTLHEVCAPLADLSAGRQTVVFAASVLHAKALAAMLNTYQGDGSAVAVSGETDRSSLYADIERFRRGEFRTLVNCALLTEGFDAPEVSCVAMARPTRSRALYAQCIGRGTRLAPHVGKTDLLALDFVPRGDGVGLVTPAHVLDDSVDNRLAQFVGRMGAERPGVPVHVLVERARKELAELDRVAAIEKARAATYQVLDAGDVTVSRILGVTLAAGRFGGMPATPTQLDALNKIGVKGEFDRGQASAVLAAVSDRRSAGLCSYKQALQLLKRGLNPDVSAALAGEAMSKIAGNGWRTPRELYLDPRFRPVRSSPSAA